MNNKTNKNYGDQLRVGFTYNWANANFKKLRSISKLTTINNGQRLIFALIKEGHQIIKQILIRKEAIA